MHKRISFECLFMSCCYLNEATMSRNGMLSDFYHVTCKHWPRQLKVYVLIYIYMYVYIYTSKHVAPLGMTCP